MFDHTLLAEKMNRSVRKAVAFEEMERQRPANHEVLDFLRNVETEATTLLRRLASWTNSIHSQRGRRFQIAVRIGSFICVMA